MNDPRLALSTGVQPVDAVLRDVVRTFEQAFPSRVRSYYLIGSYVEGTAVPLSDIDCSVIFADQFVTPDEETAAKQVGRQCAETSPIRLDIGACPEHALAQVHPVIRVALKLGSKLVYGADIRHTIPLPPIPEYTTAVIAGAEYFMAQLRGEAKLLTRELCYPDASDAFFGYTRKRIPAWYPATIPAGTKELVATVSRISTARIVRQTQRYVPGKQQAIELFQHEIGGPWTPFVKQIFARCKLDWKYLVPQAERERRELRELCRQMLAFENEFLQVCQE